MSSSQTTLSFGSLLQLFSPHLIERCFQQANCDSNSRRLRRLTPLRLRSPYHEK